MSDTRLPTTLAGSFSMQASSSLLFSRLYQLSRYLFFFGGAMEAAGDLLEWQP